MLLHALSLCILQYLWSYDILADEWFQETFRTKVDAATDPEINFASCDALSGGTMTPLRRRSTLGRRQNDASSAVFLFLATLLMGKHLRPKFAFFVTSTKRVKTLSTDQ